MPRTTSAKKALRSSLAKKTRNYARRTRIKSAETSLVEAAAAGAKDTKEKLAVAMQAIDRALKRNILHRNTAARRKAKLARIAKSAK